MERYTNIKSAMFGDRPLDLPMSVRLFRKAQEVAAGSSQAMPTMVQLGQVVVGAEVKLRGMACGEALALGAQETLSLVMGSSQAAGRDRTITMAGAVLTAVELDYSQSAPACCTLRFLAQASQDNLDPLVAKEAT